MEDSKRASVDEIRERFDKDVERFSNLETGQTAIVDAKSMLDLIAEAAAAVNPGATRLLDLGCGAGNFTLRLMQALPLREVTLVDLSQPMLDRARERLAGAAAVTAIQSDIRDLTLANDSYDVVVAAAVLHHLRTPDEWRGVFRTIHRCLAPGGSFWISDLVRHGDPAIQRLMWKRYGEYLTAFRDEAYRDHVLRYVEYEDTPAPLPYQLDLLRQVGFSEVEVLHKHNCFAAFGGIK